VVEVTIEPGPAGQAHTSWASTTSRPRCSSKAKRSTSQRGACTACRGIHR
jgi:hypothetical protein